ncbi:MAG: hypothetical protein KAW09_03825 [Thermoplasmata archaeon]|nr:hypothetical protein [Thermoplasmata archaeon]
MKTIPHWFYDPARFAFVHVRGGDEVDELSTVIPAECFDCIITIHDAHSFLDFITKEHPEMASFYKGRDSEDIKVINRLIDVIELWARKSCVVKEK